MLWVWISIRARCTTLCDKVCQWLATGQWFSPGPPLSSTNKTDRHDIAELLLKVALNTIKQQKNIFLSFYMLIRVKTFCHFTHQLGSGNTSFVNNFFYISGWREGSKQHTPFVNCATHNIWGQTTDLQKFYLQMGICEK